MKRYFRRTSTEQLTNGNITQSILMLALPLLVRSVLQSIQSVVDIFWVGKLGAVSVAAVAMGSTVIMAFFPIFIGIGTGTIAMVSRAMGSRNQPAADNAATQSIIIAFLAALILSIVGLIFSEDLLRLLQASDAVLAEGSIYLKVLLLGAITTTLLFLGGAILQGAGDTITPMIIMSLTVIANIILDPLLIFGLLGFPRLEVVGAALATVIAQALGSIWIIHILMRGKSKIHIKFLKFRINLDTIWQIIKIGVPSSVQMFLRNLMSMVLIGIVASFGTFAVAAYGIGVRLRMVVLLPAFAFGAAASTLVGQNLGAKSPKRARLAALRATLINALIMTAIGVLFFVFADNIIAIFNNNPDVIRLGTRYLKITSLFFPAIALGVVLGRSLMGAGDTIAPMFISLVSLWGLQIPLALGLSKYTALGVNGIWWAIAAASLVNGLLTLIWFETGKWKKKKIKLSI